MPTATSPGPSAARYWAEQDGAPPLTALMDQAVTTFEPLLGGLG